MGKLNWEKMTVEELEAEVRRHNRLYFIEHKPVISDYEFDRLVEELKKRKPGSKALTEIVSDVSRIGAKVIHEVPMLSLDKAYDEKTVDDWAEKFEGDVIASPKIDGCAVSLKYGKDGELFQGATRGDGIEGEDITPNVRFIKSIPRRINLKNVEIRGEVYMPLSVFSRYKKEFANPRNLAAGAIKQKDPRKTGAYELSFWAYDILGADFTTEVEKRKYLEKEKFPVVEWKKIPKEKMQKTFEDFLARRNKFDFETDGVVFKADLVAEQERLGSTAHHPRFAIAYKYQGETGVTLLKDIEWSVARTGIITPIAIVEPVELSGVTVSRASLHNIGIMKKLGVSKGARVLMMRRGEVIPHVESVVEGSGKTVEIPKRCPACGSPTELKDDFLYCTNSKSCVAAKMAELEHFIKEIGCDGFGEKLIGRLYETGLVTDPSEFYELTADELLRLERMGDVLAAKLIKNITDKRELSLEVFLRSLGIREVGRHVSKILGEYGDIKKIMALTEEELSAIKTIGPVIAREVVGGLKQKRPLIEKLLRHVKIKKVKAKVKVEGALAGKKVLFTGALIAMERRAAQALVEEAGGEAAEGVSRELDYLVVGDGGGAGSKLNKVKKIIAEGGKTKILTEKEFLKLLNK
jgi:DNA ligase (NAD+)